MKSFCVGKENCRRQHLLRALGDTEQLQQDRHKCCCHCTPKGVPYPKLAVMIKKVTCKRKRKEPPPITLSKKELEELRKKLLKERDTAVAESIGLRMLGSEVVCSSSVISEICQQAPYIQRKQDMSKISGLRPQLYERMFNIVISMTENIAPPTKR